MRCTCLLSLLGLTCSLASAATLRLTVRDESGAVLPCRMLVRGSDGECVAPEGAVTLKTGRDVWFMSAGESQVDVPVGLARVRVERGHEFARIKEDLPVTAAGAAKTLTLHRWINMHERGYLNGENHLHVDTARLARMLVADGLDFGSSLTWWRGPDALRPIPAGEGRIRLLEFAGRQVPTTVYDAELEYSWGAAYVQELPRPMPVTAEPGRPNLDYLRHAAERGALIHYQAGWSREVLLDALLGYVHTVNVCNNNFALHRFQPRSRYSNLLEVDGFPVYADTDVDMLRMNTDTYYRLLNCGLKLAAGAGSATGVKEAPAGYNRAYVRCPAGASISAFHDAWRGGRNFVTNGPMLFLRTGSGERPGDTIELGADGGDVRLHVEAVSDQPLTSVEIVSNGSVVASLDANDARHVTGTHTLTVEEGAWIAARCTIRDELLTDEELTAYEDDGTRGRLTVAPSRLRFAHTSPIYVTVGGSAAAVRTSIEEGLRVLDQLSAFTKQTAAPTHEPGLQSAIVKARDLLESRLRP